MSSSSSKVVPHDGANNAFGVLGDIAENAMELSFDATTATGDELELETFEQELGKPWKRALVYSAKHDDETKRQLPQEYTEHHLASYTDAQKDAMSRLWSPLFKKYTMGKDTPSFPKGSGKQGDISESINCVVAVGFGQFYNYGAGESGFPLGDEVNLGEREVHRVSAGCIGPGSTVKAFMDCNSQVPCIRLQVKVPAKDMVLPTGEVRKCHSLVTVTIPLNGLKTVDEECRNEDGSTYWKAEPQILHYTGEEQKSYGQQPPSADLVKVVGSFDKHAAAGLQSVIDRHEKGQIWETNFHLIKPEENGRDGINFRPVIDGYDARKLKKIYDHSFWIMYGGNGDEPQLSFSYGREEEMLAWLMYASTHVILQQAWAPEILGLSIDSLVNYQYDLARLTTNVGNCWWYKLQIGNKTLEQVERFDKLIPPPNAVTEWSVFWNGRNLKVRHEKTNAIKAPLRAADLRTAVFLNRLAGQRELQAQRAKLQLLRGSPSEGLLAQPIKVPGSPGCYIIGLTLPDGIDQAVNSDASGEASGVTKLKPDVGTRVRANVRGKLDSELVQMQGTLVENVFGADLSAYLVLSAHTYDYRDVPFIEEKIAKKGSGGLFVELDYIDDPTSIRREDGALDALLSRSAKIPVGADVPHFMFGANQNLKRRNAKNVTPEQVTKWKSVMERHGLRDECLEAAVRCLRPDQGVHLMIGPPGTGKSHTISAIIEGKVLVLEDRVLVCAPTNAAALALVRGFLKRSAGVNKKDIVIMNFSRPGKWAVDILKDMDAAALMDVDESPEAKQQREADKAAAIAEAEEIQIQLNDPAWRVLLDDQKNDLAKYMFPVMFQQAIVDWMKLPSTDEHQASADRYVKAQAAWQDFRAGRTGSATGGDVEMSDDTADHDKKMLQMELIAAKDECLKLFWATKKVVVCTLNSSVHPLLAPFFEPRVLVVDEAAVASLPALACPLAGASTSVQEILLVGDTKQHRPRATNIETSEAHHLLECSVLELCLGEQDFNTRRFPSAKFGYTYLATQYRMHEDIGGWLMTEFYPGMKHIRKTTGLITDVQATLQDFFTKKLGNGWNRHFRLGVDVSSGPTGFKHLRHGLIQSTTVHKSTTSENRAEADEIVSLIDMLTKWPAPQGGRKIELKDFIIGSPYEGQVRLIQTRLAANGLVGPIVLNSSSIQGSEAKICLVSLCKNDLQNPENIGFIWRPEQLNVELSRGADMLIVFANFFGFALAYEAGVWHASGKKKWNSFIEEMYVGIKDNRSGRQNFRNEAIAYDAWRKAMASENPVQPAPDSLWVSVPKARKDYTNGNFYGRGHDSSRAAPSALAILAKHEEKAKKSKAKTHFPSDKVTKSKPGPRGGGGRGGRGGRGGGGQGGRGASTAAAA